MALLVIGRKNKEEPALKAGSWTLLGANNQEDGGAEEDRTPDLRMANAKTVLYRSTTYTQPVVFALIVLAPP